MGVVYKILFPCGRFYISATKNELLERLRKHQKGDNSGYAPKKLKYMNSVSLLKLWELTNILYIGANYKDYEGFLINQNINKKLCLNSLRPKFNKPNGLTIQKYIDKYRVIYKKAYPGAYDK